MRLCSYSDSSSATFVFRGPEAVVGSRGIEKGSVSVCRCLRPDVGMGGGSTIFQHQFTPAVPEGTVADN